MNLDLYTPTISLSVDLTPEQVTEILGIALSYACGVPYEKPMTPPVVSSVKPPEPPIIEETTVLTPAPKEPKKGIPKESTSKPGFSGFLYIKCEECGQFKAFMPKAPLTKYHCDCGHTTHLEVMTPMKVNCKCGKQFKYLTNALDSVISIDCLSCGSPVDLEYHGKCKEYHTII